MPIITNAAFKYNRTDIQTPHGRVHPFNGVTADPFDLVAADMEQSLDSSLSKIYFTKYLIFSVC